MSNIPRKPTRKVASASAAVATSALALADAAARGTGLNLETLFPGGRMQLMVGTITITRSEEKTATGKAKKGTRRRG